MRPAVVYHPGEHLKDELLARDWTQKAFAEMIGRSPVLVNDIVNGRRGISVKTAIEIGAVLGTSAQFWLNLDSAYRLWKYQEDEIARQKFLETRQEHWRKRNETLD